jgi:hypothetical protein
MNGNNQSFVRNATGDPSIPRFAACPDRPH